MTLDSIQRIAQTDAVPVDIAASHYADAIERGRRVGRAEMLGNMVQLMKSEEFHDYVWKNWRNERELYEVMVKYILEKNRITHRPIKSNSSPQHDRLERSQVEADLG